jgi:hypothetical protein
MKTISTHLRAFGLTALLIGSAGHAAARVINHDSVVPFEPDVTDYQAFFQPRLDVTHGCVPFPAVNRQGDVSGGLKPSGSTNGGCSRNRGQVYVRAKNYNGGCAVMYSWYFPKDEVSPGRGHRHDWENVVLFLSECSKSGGMRAISYSGHGGYTKFRRVPRKDSHPLVERCGPRLLLLRALRLGEQQLGLLDAREMLPRRQPGDQARRGNHQRGDEQVAGPGDERADK